MEHKKILIAEDEISILNALGEKFLKRGFEVSKAEDGEEALKLAEDGEYDLLLFDVIMPRMDGLTLVKKVRELNKWGKNVPIIILTNLNDPDTVYEAKDLNVSFLVKTEWSLDEVADKVDEKINA